ncbi:N(6)-adenine-specific DNA methyltransferase 2 [Phytophthora cinnamomi]|uniref:N(6)-adenine-specific DNA methyltransferase 2 n=1 Tax=Phytophthora cinnamomi TaxID=4785 RepID=UPI00355A69A7|nr:N(6)-adenine-specific DNA methyltransferase 2 [Phytophthora cinnamomi]
MFSSSSTLPSTAVRPFATGPPSMELPKLRIPIEAGRQETGRGRDDTRAPAGGYHAAPPVPVKTEGPSAAAAMQHGPTTRSPSSPSSFFSQPEIAKLGLTPLLEAAEQVRPSMAETSPLLGRSSPLKRELPQLHALPSIMHAMGGYPLETSSMPKRARMGSDVGLDVQASYSLLGHMPRQAMIYPSIPQQQHYHQGATTYAPATEVQSPSNAGSSSPGALGLPANSSVSVWDTVLSTGKFPTDVSLSEHGSGAASPTTPFNVNKSRSNSEDATESAEAETSSEVKQGRWTADEEQYASSLIRAVNSGEVVLPPNVSVRKFIADSLQCKTMRVSKKFRSLGSSPRGAPEEEPVSPRDESFNPLSLKSIMNNESSAAVLVSDVLNVAEAMANPNVIRPSPSIRSGKKSTQRVLKRSDYSQHGRVRSGRWSMEEENYAKAMIEAFKAGYLPLHGNVSLRKFLSEVLVCHPMRISKKFVGYVRKYHWYRIAAGKCDPEAKRQALYQLSHLERVFWRSLQQNSEWSTGLRRDD